MNATFVNSGSALKLICRLYLLALLSSISAFALFAQNTKPADTKRPLQSGKSDAFIKIEVFYDMQCPACANFHSILKDVEAKFGDKIGITFRHFPLKIPTHDKAIMASRMIEAAMLQGKGRQMLETIFANQKKWSFTANARLILFGYATKLKLNMRKFRSDYEDDKTMRPIIEDQSELTS